MATKSAADPNAYSVRMSGMPCLARCSCLWHQRRCAQAPTDAVSHISLKLQRLHRDLQHKFHQTSTKGTLLQADTHQCCRQHIFIAHRPPFLLDSAAGSLLNSAAFILTNRGTFSSMGIKPINQPSWYFTAGDNHGTGPEAAPAPLLLLGIGFVSYAGPQMALAAARSSASTASMTPLVSVHVYIIVRA